MLWISLGILAALTLTFVTLSGCFLDALKQEAPHIFEAWGRPSIGRYVWRRRSFLPLSGSVSARAYRQELADFPKSRAWASWLFLVHWLQVAAVAWCLLLLARAKA